MTHTPATVRRCCACSKPAMGPYGRRAYCAEHRPSVGRPVNLDDVEFARAAMADGATLREVAQQLNLMSADLDLALWNNLGRVLSPRRYPPDFAA